MSIYKKIDSCLCSDKPNLIRMYKKYKKTKKIEFLEELNEKIKNSLLKVELNQKNIPKIIYDEKLPIFSKKSEIIDLIKNNQVVVIAGETGSGKTTQLPKFCLEAGLGIKGIIGHTQPRRIAARSVADRISEELKVKESSKVSYKIRFNDKTTSDTFIKVMTDGILLNEAHNDRFLNKYDAIIIDEAHERSLNIDFLLGILKKLLIKRKDLKVIITSATIDVEKFSNYFNKAPIVEVSGRTFPVEIRYKEDDYEFIDAVRELYKEGPGDILAFFPSEKDIREANKSLLDAKLLNTEIIPLFSRLSVSEQQKIFHSFSGRRIILSTNIAETSLTVPGIKYVIDIGTARVSRYNYRNQVQRLLIERVSQASANQRSGRCGRLSDGICIRLFSEQDFIQRPLYTDPEIKRTGLAQVILQMLSLELGDVEKFPFIEEPELKYIKEGFRILYQIKAITEDYKLTHIGKKIAKLPIEPRLGAILINSCDYAVVESALIIVSFLSIQDPRERPFEKQQESDEKHSRFKDKKSDFIGVLNLWNYLQEQKKELSRNKFRDLCKKEFFSYKRIEDWFDIYSQLKQLLKELKISISEVYNYDNLHMAILSGTLSNIAHLNEKNEYSGANGRNTVIFPGSYLKNKNPKWLTSFSLIETAKVYSHMVAEINPLWIEKVSGHLIREKYDFPFWDEKAGQVLAFKTGTLFGLTIYSNRKSNYFNVEPKIAREVFIRSALVERNFKTKLSFFEANSNIIDEIKYLEDKSREKNILIDDDKIYDFYDSLIPEGVYNEVTLIKHIRDNSEKKFYLKKEFLIERDHDVTENKFPDFLVARDLKLPLSYNFDRAKEDDGVTVTLSSSFLDKLNKDLFEWLVPGLLDEKLNFLLKSLPKALRKNFVPVNHYAKALKERIEFGRGNFFEIVAENLFRMTGTFVPKNSWDNVEFPNYLKMTFIVKDLNNNIILTTKQWDNIEKDITNSSIAVSCDNLYTSWPENIDFDKKAKINKKEVSLDAYLALCDKKDGVGIKRVVSNLEADLIHIRGICRLIYLQEVKTVKYLQKNFKIINDLTFKYFYPDKDNLFDDMVMGAIKCCFLTNFVPKNKEQFDKVLEKKVNFISHFNKILTLAKKISMEFNSITKILRGINFKLFQHVETDINFQLDNLLKKDMFYETEVEWLSRIPIYLQAVQLRLNNLNNEKDNLFIKQIQYHWDEFEKYFKESNFDKKCLEYRWMIEEFRVSLFAQNLKTIKPVSHQRLLKLLKKIKD